ncbi:hypothetical protein C8J56DRAFT_952464 [Mycena floridula]|nr:hypothetical protein C8J56DRAFT_952464 [Mycena floridula]
MLFSNIAATTLLVAAFSVSAMPMPAGEASGSGSDMAVMDPKDMMLDPTAPGGSVNSGYGYSKEEREERERQRKKIDKNEQNKAKARKKKAEDPAAYLKKDAQRCRDYRKNLTPEQAAARREKDRVNKQRKLSDETAEEKKARLKNKNANRQRKRAEAKAAKEMGKDKK